MAQRILRGMNAFTTVSASGDLPLPQETRDRLGWHPGVDLEIIEAGDSVTYRIRRDERTLEPAEAVRLFKALRRHDGPPVTLEQMAEDARRMASGEDTIAQ